MAFVFRDKRTSFVDQTTIISNNIIYDEQTVNLSNIKKSPIKGTTVKQCPTPNNSHDNLNLIMIHKSKQHIIKPSKPKQNYYFKSKLTRPSNTPNKHPPIVINKKHIKQYKSQQNISNINVNRSILKTLNESKQVGKIPSIPSKRNQYGYVVKENNQISLPKLVQFMKYQGNSNHMPGPTDYSPKKIMRSQLACKFSSTKQPLGQINNNKLIDNNQQNQQKHRKNKTEIKIKYIKAYQQQQTTSQEEYISDSNPGPGSYILNQPSKPSFRSKKQQYQNIFFSKQKRFIKNDVHYQQVTYVNNQNKLKKPQIKKQGFIFRTKRDFSPNNHIVSPSPGQYENRNTIEHKSINKMLKGSNSSCFITLQKRFNEDNDEGKPGPGYYQFSTYNKADQVKNITYHQQPTKTNNNLNNGTTTILTTIKVKEEIIHSIHNDKMNQFVLSPPFLSSQSRFNYHPKLEDIKHQTPVIINKQKKHQNLYPFNSSSNKGMEVKVGQGAAVGSYRLFQDSQWNKKTHNILFN